MDRQTSFENGPRYIAQPDAEARNIRMDAEGNLWGEVPVMLAQGPVSPDLKTHIWSAGERRFVPTRFLPEVPEDLPGDTLKPDPLRARTASEFVSTMRRYRRWAGSPSYREMADRVGVRSSSRFCEALKSDRLPTFALLDAFVVSLGGNSADFQRWAAAWRALDGEIGQETHQPALTVGEATE